MRRVVKWAAWSIAGLLALVVLLYAVLVAVNWRDRRPSEVAIRFGALYRDRPAIPDAQNAFVFVTGFDVGREEDPRAAGIRRLAWMREHSGADTFPGEDPVARDLGYREARPPPLQEFLASCRSLSSAACATAFSTNEELFTGWLEREGWLLDRYQALIRHAGWLETVPFDERAPLPPYSGVTDGQRLLLVKASVLAREGDTSGVKALLEADVRFWRNVLASADILITKMIAVAALHRTFEGGNLVLRQLPAPAALQAMPEDWQRPISNIERSMLRTLVGEWVYANRFGAMSRRPEWLAGEDPGLLDVLRARLIAPFFKPQDTSNQQAEALLHLCQILDSPLPGYSMALEEAEAEMTIEELFSVDLFYNPVGDIVLAIALPAFVPYGARVADVEGVRRAAVLANNSRYLGVAAERMEDELADSDLRDPYTGEPFDWDDEGQAIVFRGLAEGQASLHVVKY